MFVASQLFWYKMLFLFELLTAEGLFVTKFRKKNHFAVRLGLCLVGTALFAFFYPLAQYSVLYNSGIFLAIFVVTLLGMNLCFEESGWNVLFAGLAGYSVQHIAFVIYSLIFDAFNLRITLSQIGAVIDPYADERAVGINPIAVIIYVDCYILIYWYLGMFLRARMEKNEDLSLGRKPLIVVAATLISIEIVFHMVTIMNTEIDRVSLLMEDVYNLICCALTLFLQFGVLSHKKLEQDNDILQKMLIQKQEQYEIRRESMEIINVKHHDLKKQLNLLRRVVDEKALRGMEEAVNQYDTLVKTGNEYLDLILTEKSMLCQAKQIAFSYIVGENHLEFMDPLDVYSVFGNAMENAMEYVEKLDDPEKRFIHFSLKTMGNMVIARVENYYTGDRLEGDGALPETTKADKQYHGFGLKSIQMTAEKYDGEMAVSAENHLFKVNIMMPVPMENMQNK